MGVIATQKLDQKTQAEQKDASLSKGERRRQEIIEATAELILEGGPSNVTHRKVARRANCSLSATTHYFSGLDDLLAEGGKLNIKRWSSRAKSVIAEIERQDSPAKMEDRINLILKACLPHHDNLENHYKQLVAASNHPAVANAYGAGRQFLDQAVNSLLKFLGIKASANIVIAIIDGAAVAAISEGGDVRHNVTRTLREFLETLA